MVYKRITVYGNVGIILDVVLDTPMIIEVDKEHVWHEPKE